MRPLMQITRGRPSPEGEARLCGEQGGSVGPDPEERGVPEGDLSRVTDDHVEAADGDGLDGDHCCDRGDVGAHAVSYLDEPSSPSDRHMSTPIMAIKASASLGRGMFA